MVVKISLVGWEAFMALFEPRVGRGVFGGGDINLGVSQVRRTPAPCPLESNQRDGYSNFDSSTLNQQKDSVIEL